MPRFSANLSTLFREHAPLDRPSAAHAAGFHCVEMQFPYDLDASELVARLTAHEQAVSVINIPCGDFVGGGEGNSAIADRSADFHDAVDTAKRYADTLRPLNVNLLAGAPSAGRDPAACRAALVDNIRHAASALAAIDIRLVVEAINTTSVPGFFLPTPDAVIDILDEAGHPNAALQYDLFHVEMMGLPQIETFAASRDLVGHIQFADAPGRHEPGTGTIHFGPIFNAIDASGYDGWVAAEYLPVERTEDGLGWMAEYA